MRFLENHFNDEVGEYETITHSLNNLAIRNLHHSQNQIEAFLAAENKFQ